MNILLIDDDKGDIYLIKEAFRTVYPEDHVVAIENGEHALPFLKKNSNFDLLILDLNLPQKHGLEILIEIKKDERLKHLVVVILTTSRWKSEHEASRVFKADASFTKPMEFSGFVKLVKSMKDLLENKKVT